MTVNELYQILNEAIPSSLSCDWDNDGLMICPDGNKEVKKVYFCLDATEYNVDKAIESNADVIITHHPLIFSKIGCVVNPIYIKLIKAGVAVFSFHTRLDALHPDGVNDALGDILGLDNLSPLGMMTAGETDLSDLKDFAKSVKEKLESDTVAYIDGKKPVKKVAVLGGKCDGEFFGLALENGCDTVVTGEAGYNTILDWSAKGLNIITAGHFYTEFPVLAKLGATVSSCGIDSETQFTPGISAI